MRLIVGILACLSVCGISAALADPPAASATAPLATSVAPSATAIAPADDAQQARHLTAMGYHAEMHNGTKLWCKAEPSVGSRLASNGTKQCSTAQQIEAAAQETQSRLQQSLNQQHNVSGH